MKTHQQNDIFEHLSETKMETAAFDDIGYDASGIFAFSAFLLGTALGTGVSWIGLLVTKWIGGFDTTHASPFLSVGLLVLTGLCATRPGFYDETNREKLPLEFVIWLEVGLFISGAIVIFAQPYGMLLLAILV